MLSGQCKAYDFRGVSTTFLVSTFFLFFLFRGFVEVGDTELDEAEFGNC